MKTINQNILRIGNFTSSEIVALTSVGKRDLTPDELSARPKKGPGSKTTTINDINSHGESALTYIQECNMERRLGRSLSDESSARPLSWGTLLEKRVFELLGTEYILMGDATFPHATIDCWKGSPDVTKPDTLGEIKCPMTLKSFCQLVDPLYSGLTGMDAINAIRDTHKDGDKYYWQCVSNAILTDSKYAELIIYMPFKSELQAVREMTQNCEPEEAYKFFWIANANDEELPYLLDGGYYRNLNVIRFEVSEHDKYFLTKRVELASKELIELIPEPVDHQ